jgi:hypothetical protein
MPRTLQERQIEPTTDEQIEVHMCCSEYVFAENEKTKTGLEVLREFGIIEITNRCMQAPDGAVYPLYILQPEPAEAVSAALELLGLETGDIRLRSTGLYGSMESVDPKAACPREVMLRRRGNSPVPADVRRPPDS